MRRFAVGSEPEYGDLSCETRFEPGEPRVEGAFAGSCGQARLTFAAATPVKLEIIAPDMSILRPSEHAHVSIRVLDRCGTAMDTGKTPVTWTLGEGCARSVTELRHSRQHITLRPKDGGHCMLTAEIVNLTATARIRIGPNAD